MTMFNRIFTLGALFLSVSLFAAPLHLAGTMRLGDPVRQDDGQYRLPLIVTTDADSVGPQAFCFKLNFSAPVAAAAVQLAASFLLDTAHYYIFVVIPAYRVAKKFLSMPVLGPKPAFFSYHLIKFYNRRFKAIAMARRAAGESGVRNDGRRISAYFNLSFAPMRMALRGMKLWLFAELNCVLMSFRAALRLRSGQAATARNPAPTERSSCFGTGFLDRPPPLRGSGGSE